MKLKPLFFSTIAIVALSASANADNDGRERARRGPPPEALEACASGATGDICSFAGRRGETVSGTCEARHSDELVCFPEGGPPQRGGRSDEDNDGTA